MHDHVLPEQVLAAARDELAAFRPDRTPPFAALQARRRSRDLRRRGAALAGCALAVGAVAFAPSALDGSSRARVPDRLAGTEVACRPAHVEDRSDGYRGLTESQARNEAHAQGLSSRVVGRDGACLAVTLDLRPDRLDLLVEDGKVVQAWRPESITAPALRAPAAQRLAATDEFGAVARTQTRPDGTLRVFVDRVDWLSGSAAQAAAAADGTDAGDYYVVDSDHVLRAYDVSPTARVFGSIGMTGVPDLTPCTLQDWTRFLTNGPTAFAGTEAAQAAVRSTYFHFDVDDGVVVGIEEQYRA